MQATAFWVLMIGKAASKSNTILKSLSEFLHDDDTRNELSSARLDSICFKSANQNLMEEDNYYTLLHIPTKWIYPAQLGSASLYTKGENKHEKM